MNKAYKIQYEKKTFTGENYTVWQPEIVVIWTTSEEEALADLVSQPDNIQNIIVLETWDSVEPEEEAPMESYEEPYTEDEELELYSEDPMIISDETDEVNSH